MESELSDADGYFDDTKSLELSQQEDKDVDQYYEDEDDLVENFEDDGDYQYEPNYREERLESSSKSKRYGRERSVINYGESNNDDQFVSKNKRRKLTTIKLTDKYKDEEMDEEEQHIIKVTSAKSRTKMIMSLVDGQSSNQKKQLLSQEELQLRRAENARKRRNLSEKKLEEEKRDTINKLLKRRAGKSRSLQPQVNTEEQTTFNKQRRPYNTQGLIRTVRNASSNLFCIF